MTRPQIIRADTIDLQDQQSPSAQDHSHQPTHPAPLGVGPPAPHHDASLRHVAEERVAEQEYLADAWSSGRSSHEGSDLLDEGLRSSMDDVTHDNETRLDEAAVQQNGGEDSEMMESEGDDGIDDTLDDADKISSSPSIDDGGYSFYFLPFATCRPEPAAASSRAASGDSALIVPPPSEGRHLQGGYISSLAGRGSARGGRQLHSPVPTPYCDASTSAPTPPLPNLSEEPLDGDWPGDGYDEYSGFFRPAHEAYIESYLGDVSPPPSDSDSSWISDSDSGEESDRSFNEDDDTFDSTSLKESRFIDSGWGGDCLHELEDIDFEFVYALHTFVATVEGQANATKGDTMVLLDDSNSYWWLVRVVKDSSIGYLPAEHIETPTERLARLNKHRNIDLSATMLGDNPEKSKNPLKKAMRRRNAKIVQFAAPTYFEPSEVEWSDEENEEEQLNDLEEAGENQQATQDEKAETAEAETALTNGHTTDGDPREVEVQENGGVEQETRTAEEDENAIDDLSDYQQPTTRQTRNGTIRNTDSFFKDDTAEPRKISLTPNLLREDSAGGSSRSSDQKDRLSGAQDVFDQIEKQNATAEKSKEDRKKRDKKPGMLSGLFKKKEKRIKVDEAAGGTVAKVETDPGSPTLSPGASPDDSGQDSPTTPHSPISATADQRSSLKRPLSGGKLTKPPPQRLSKQASTESPRVAQISRSTVRSPTDAALSALPSTDSTLEGSSPVNNAASDDAVSDNLPPQPQPATDGDRAVEPTMLVASRETATPSQNTTLETRNFSQQRYHPRALDTTQQESDEQDAVSPIEPDKGNSQSNQSRFVPSTAQQYQGQAPLSLDTSQQTVRSGSPVSPSTPFDSQADDNPFEGEPKSSNEFSSRSGATAPDSLATPTASSPATTPAPNTPPQTNSNETPWHDASLRAYLDTQGHNDVKELLLLVQDKTGVVPVSHDHPMMKDLGFQEHRKQLDDMSMRLDGLLNGFLARKAASRSKSVQ